MCDKDTRGRLANTSVTIVILSLTQEAKFRYIAIHNIINHLSRMRLKTATLLVVTLISTNLFMSSSLAGYGFMSDDILCQWLEKRPNNEGYEAERERRDLTCRAKAKVERAIEVEVVAKTDISDVGAKTAYYRGLIQNKWNDLSADVQNALHPIRVFIPNLSFNDYEAEWFNTSNDHFTEHQIANKNNIWGVLSSGPLIGQVNEAGQFHGVVRDVLPDNTWIRPKDNQEVTAKRYEAGLYINGKKEGWHVVVEEWETVNRYSVFMFQYANDRRGKLHSFYKVGMDWCSLGTMTWGQNGFDGIAIYRGQALLYKNGKDYGSEGLVKVKNIGSWTPKGKTIEEATQFQLEVLQNWDTYEDAGFF